jgi:hypothetical protein
MLPQWLEQLLLLPAGALATALCSGSSSAAAATATAENIVVARGEGKTPIATLLAQRTYGEQQKPEIYVCSSLFNVPVFSELIQHAGLELVFVRSTSTIQVTWSCECRLGNSGGTIFALCTFSYFRTHEEKKASSV